MKFMRSFPAPAILIPCLAIVACVTAPRPARGVNPCVIGSEGTLGISAGLLELAPGESVRLDRPMLFIAPFLPPDTISANCEVRWSATEGGAIDNSGLLTITREALPGSTVVVRAHVDTLVARQDVRVVDPAPNPLAATWSQSTPPACANGEQPTDAIVRELVFRRGGAFTVTRVPFESYRDYWGTYTYDVSTGTLRLTVEGGNSLPGFRTAEMVARIVTDELRLEGPALSGAPAPGCRSVFKRLGERR
ncbi:MAG: hypothetical protein ABIV11_03495 [Gemmatimonadaceae bacterium]